MNKFEEVCGLYAAENVKLFERNNLKL